MTNPQVGHALDCARARALIDAFLLDELGSADAAHLAAHVKTCAACTAEIGSSTRVLGLLGSLPAPRPTPDLDERILMAALDDRARRRSQRSWLSDLRTQVIRGAMRTTGTLIVTIMTVALLGGAFVFAASQVVAQLPPFAPVARATVPPVATPSPTAPAAQTAEPSTAEPSTNATQRPSPVVAATPEPVITPAPTESIEPSISPEPSASPSPTPEPSASPTPSVEPSPSATPEPTSSPTPTPTPTPAPTEKPRRTPPPPGASTPSP